MNRCPNEWQEEFNKYQRDFVKETRKVYQNWSMSYWDHYNIENCSLRKTELGGLGKAAYHLMGGYEITNPGPEIPGYVKVPLGYGVYNELGLVFDITIDPEDDYV